MSNLNIDYGMDDGIVQGLEFSPDQSATIGVVDVPLAPAAHVRLHFSEEPVDDRPQIQRYDKAQDVLMIATTGKPDQRITERLSAEVIVERTGTTIEAVYIFGIGESPTVITPSSQ